LTVEKNLEFLFEDHY